MESVQDNRKAVIRLLTRYLGPDSRSRAEELVENGGVAVEGYNEQAATNVRDQLAEYGVEASVAQTDAALVGRVRGIRSGRPVGDAQVVVRTASGGTRLGQATTDADGWFRMPEFGRRLREEVSADQPDLDVEVTRDGQAVESRHKPFDWEAYARGDYDLEIEAAPPDDAPSDGPTEDPSYRVEGRVTASDGSPVDGVTVRAFDRDLRSEQELGSATTDAEGHYEIAYAADAFASAERGGPDLVVRAYDDAGGDHAVVGSSDTRFDAGVEATIDVEVDRKRLEHSEYDRLVAELRPLLDGVSPADLTDGDVTFLVNDTGIEGRTDEFPAGAESIRLYAAGADLNARTGVATEVFYALGRRDVELTLDSVLGLSFETVRESVSAAVEAGIASPSVTDSLEQAKATFDRLRASRRSPAEPESPAEATVRVYSEDDGTPLVGYGVRVAPASGDGSEQRLTTDESGSVAVGFTTSSGGSGESSGSGGSSGSDDSDDPSGSDGSGGSSGSSGSGGSDDSGSSAKSGRRFAVRVLDDAGTTVHETTVTLSDGVERTIQVPTPTPGFDAGTALSDLGASGAVELSDATLEALGDRTLAEVRTVGGAENLDVDVSALPDADRVNALATLTLTVEPATATTLHDRGYASFIDIAAEPRDAFLESVSDVEGVSTEVAERIHARGRAQLSFLDEVVLAERKAWANRRWTPSRVEASRGGGQ